MDAETLRRLYYDDGLSLRDIADHFDCSEGKVRYHMDKNDIERRSKGEARRLQNVAEVYVGETQGRFKIEFREFGEHRQFALSKLVALLDHPTWDVLGDGRHVHHVNGQPLDDRPENLEPLSKPEHGKRHPPKTAGDSDVARIGGLAASPDRDPDTGRFQ